ncbi:MAG: DUF554 domain-containing protein [Clostridia bacterium]|nr:DUF554 domain-containing protein [Clostridia bacterium]
MFPGAGTLINAVLVLAGGVVGLCIKKGLKPSMQETLMKALGVSTLFIGISGALTGLLTIEGGKLDTTGTMLMILSMVIGTIIGELLRIEDRMNTMAEKVKSMVKVKDEDNRFVEGLVNATLIMCVGAMAIMGALQDGLANDPSVLIAKGILDCIISMIFASTLGVGVLFSVVPLFLYQGAITLLARVIEPLLSAQLTLELTYIGSVLIFVVGYNLIFADRKIKVGNMLPALLIPVIWEVLQWAWSLLPF